MTEKIGNIVLDYTRYCGEDFYCDGAVEDELLEIVKSYLPKEYIRVIEERASWPIFYHLSPLRENIVSWIPLSDTDKVLEVGSGCGAITGALAGKAKSVTCIDLSKKRSLINAYRHQQCENVTIHVGNFTDIEPDLPEDYDTIFLIGVFEYGQSYIAGKHPYEDFLAILQKHVKKGGRIVIAIENKLGLKYFAGCKEDHLGTYFSGIEDYAQGGGVRTFSRNGLERILLKRGIREYSFYYPYPDYKFMTSVYSDDYLPKVGELSTNMRNFDRDRMLLFDEKNAFDGIIRDGLFPVFSNSYLCVLGAPISVRYAKFSNDRAEEFAIRTDIVKQGEAFYVEKSPLGIQARKHVAAIERAYELLSARYRGSKLQVNQCERAGSALRFAYIEGVTLEEMFDNLLDQEDMDGFLALLREYIGIIDYGSASNVSDYDLIFSNILVQEDTWTMIDYEWTFEQAISTQDIAYRAFYCYFLGAEKRRKINQDLILEAIGITGERAEEIQEAEKTFQAYVTGTRLPVGDIHTKIGYEVLSPFVWEAKYQDHKNKLRVQIYEDQGKGFSEELSYFPEQPYQEEGRVVCRLPISPGTRAVRIDPAMDACVVAIEMVRIDGNEVKHSHRGLTAGGFTTNGFACGKDSFVFATTDPNMTFTLPAGDGTKLRELSFALHISRIPMTMAEAMLPAKRK